MQHWSTRSELDRSLPSQDFPAAVLTVDAAAQTAGENGIPALASESRHGDIYLGIWQETQLWARAIQHIESSSFAWPLVAPEWEEPLAAALTLTQWHARQPRCEFCGQPTVSADLGTHRRCTACGQMQFARTDPAIIVGVVDPADRLLLARQGAWHPLRHSVVAGFVEPGESLEQACWREVMEEAQVNLKGVRYVASQPWPMPRSLMMGFVASTDDTTIALDGVELVSGGFFSREQVWAMQRDGSIELPSRASLGRLLIEWWLSDQLPRP